MTRVRAAIVAGALLTASAAASAQTSADDGAAMAARAAERIRTLQGEADRLAGQSRTLLGELRRLELERQISSETLAASEADLQSIDVALEGARARVASIEERRHDAAPVLAAELVEIYKRGRRRHAQVLLASAADSRALGRLVRGALALAGIERARLDAHRHTLQAEQEAVTELERRIADAAASRDAQAKARAAIERTMAERNRLIDAIDRDRDVAAQYAGELQTAREALERTLASLSPSSPPPLLPIAPFQGDLDWPVRGVVRSRFAAAHPGRSAAGIVRNGIELAATEGSAVTAIHGGRVSYAASFPGLGPLVVVDHGNVQSLYGYLASMAVTVDEVIDRGGPVGQAGVAGLYFELRVDGRPVDPLQWLRSSP